MYFSDGVMGATVGFVGGHVRRPTEPLSHPSRHQEPPTPPTPLTPQTRQPHEHNTTPHATLNEVGLVLLWVMVLCLAHVTECRWSTAWCDVVVRGVCKVCVV